MAMTGDGRLSRWLFLSFARLDHLRQFEFFELAHLDNDGDGGGSTKLGSRMRGLELHHGETAMVRTDLTRLVSCRCEEGTGAPQDYRLKSWSDGCSRGFSKQVCSRSGCDRTD